MRTSTNLDFRPDWISPPGDTIADTLSERHLSKDWLAQSLNRNRSFVDELIEGRRPIDGSIAPEIAELLGGSSEFWTTREQQYREDLKRLGIDVAPATLDDWMCRLPVADMVRYRWISPSRSHAEKLQKCMDFFGVASVADWQREFAPFVDVPAYRASRKLPSDRYALAAWLRKATLEISDQECNPWDAAHLETSIPQMRALSRSGPVHEQLGPLRQILLSAGVAFALVRTPRGCRASGATFFHSGNRAALVLSGLYRTDDHFWFSLFHELGHLVLHAQYGLIIEDANFLDSRQEEEADKYSYRCLIPPEAEDDFFGLRTNYRAILKFARRIGVSPGIVVGQLQHHGLVRRSHFNRLKTYIDWSKADFG